MAKNKDQKMQTFRIYGALKDVVLADGSVVARDNRVSSVQLDRWPGLEARLLKGKYPSIQLLQALTGLYDEKELDLVPLEKAESLALTVEEMENAPAPETER